MYFLDLCALSGPMFLPLKLSNPAILLDAYFRAQPVTFGSWGKNHLILEQNFVVSKCFNIYYAICS